MAATAAVVDRARLDTRETNRAIRAAVAQGQSVKVVNPGANHNIGVALQGPVTLTVDGSAGYYCAGMNDGVTIEITGSAGWGVAEGMLSGLVVVRGNAGNSAAASIRGGTVIVHGDCAARAGTGMKGGLLLVGGSVGYMTGFMMQRGAIVICGDAGEALADSMYEGRIFIAGNVASLGNDAVEAEITPEDEKILVDGFKTSGIARPKRLRKIVAGRKLWNFHKHELAFWREAL
ncbi:MAG: glutamate synthase [Chloroflexi bacterium]|nr:glutamate synthase [Chloroflexota bacterium]